MMGMHLAIETYDVLMRFCKHSQVIVTKAQLGKMNDNYNMRRKTNKLV